MVNLHDWMAYLQSVGRSPHTVRARVGALTLLCEYRGINDPTTITNLDTIAFLGRPLAQWTRLTYWVGINAWGQFVREFGGIPDFQPTKGVERPRTPEPVARPITDAEVVRLLNSPMATRTRAYVEIALYQGLRVHEIAKLRGEDVDLQAGWMTILGKGRIEKSIPIHPAVQAVAQTMPSIGWWFPSISRSGHVTATAVSTAILKAMRRAGITASAHQLRDTFGTRMQRQTRDIRITQTMLRHKSVTSTQKYTAVADFELKRALKSLSWDNLWDDAA